MPIPIQSTALRRLAATAIPPPSIAMASSGSNHAIAFMSWIMYPSCASAGESTIVICCFEIGMLMLLTKPRPRSLRACLISVTSALTSRVTVAALLGDDPGGLVGDRHDERLVREPQRLLPGHRELRRPRELGGGLPHEVLDGVGDRRREQQQLRRQRLGGEGIGHVLLDVDVGEDGVGRRLGHVVLDGDVLGERRHRVDPSVLVHDRAVEPHGRDGERDQQHADDDQQAPRPRCARTSTAIARQRARRSRRGAARLRRRGRQDHQRWMLLPLPSQPAASRRASLRAWSAALPGWRPPPASMSAD